jgi:hypothetical protein
MMKGRREMMYDQRQKRVHRLITHKSNYGLLVHADDVDDARPVGGAQEV